ncbi:hypothetical protein [Alteromonas sp. a30]|uniref:hypothetical protein n=1 Tax=Alteromonas sp. a30 TaxID=2730917 RepID=UPI002281517F|nr:hypothetical protein [Alteromonas sp. a30]MCY7297452.1 hypothetical protein [Alteromonas sp. a30]
MEILTDLKWQDIVAILGLIAGVVTVIAYIDQRRKSASDKKLIDFVERHLERDISKEEILDLQTQKRKMEEEVSILVPQLARQAALRQQEHMLQTSLLSYYVEWKKAKEELDSLEIEISLDEKLEKAVLDRMVPEYERKEKEQSYKDRLTILSMGIVFARYILPYTVEDIVQIILAIALGITLFQYMAAKYQGSKHSKQAANAILGLYIFTGVVFLVFGAGLITYSDWDTEIAFGYAFSFFGLLSLAAVKWIRAKIYKYLKYEPNKSSQQDASEAGASA